MDEITEKKLDSTNKSKSISRKPFKRDRKPGKRGYGAEKDGGGNDFAFWNEYADLMSLAARFPWMHIAGTKLVGHDLEVKLANVAVQHYLPIPGVQENATSPINLMFRQMYLDMHRRYRGIGAYQASDIAITVLCIESVLQKIIEAERIYGLMNCYPIKNRVQPRGLLKAMGYTTAFISNVASNMADFRYGINRLISLARRLPLPNGMSFFANHISLNAFVYADSDKERASIIVFEPDAYFEYKTTGEVGCINSAGTALLVPFYRGDFSTYQGLLNNIEASLTVLLYDSDILRITSDFIACYGESSMQVLQELPEDYKVIPQYSESILFKWHNSERKFVSSDNNVFHRLGYEAVSNNTTKINPNDILGTICFAVYQENDIVYSLPTYCDGSTPAWKEFVGGNKHFFLGTTAVPGYFNTAHIVDTWKDQTDVGDCCEAVLWKANSYKTTLKDSYYTVKLRDFSTELFSDLMLFRVVGDDASASFNMEWTTTPIMTNITDVGCRYISQFDWAPITYIIGAGDPNNPVTEVLGDVDNCSSVTTDTIIKVIDAALLSAFKVKVNPSGPDGKN